MNNRKVYGVYQNEHEASEALANLRNMGYREDEISVLTKSRDFVEDENAHLDEGLESATTEGFKGGAATGATLGGVAGLLASLGALAIPGIGPFLAAGPIAATLGGALAGGTIGGTLGVLAGALVDAGVPEEDARYLDDRFNQGDIIILVDSDEARYEETSRYLNYDPSRLRSAKETAPVQTNVAKDVNPRVTDHESVGQSSSRVVESTTYRASNDVQVVEGQRRDMADETATREVLHDERVANERVQGQPVDNNYRGEFKEDAGRHVNDEKILQEDKYLNDIEQLDEKLTPIDSQRDDEKILNKPTNQDDQYVNNEEKAKMETDRFALGNTRFNEHLPGPGFDGPTAPYNDNPGDMHDLYGKKQ